jgi:CpeT protein
MYRVFAESAAARRQIFELSDDPSRFVGGYDDPAHFNGLTPDDLTAVEGCSVYLTPLPGSFSGSTRGDECKNAWGEAVYATSIVELSPERILSWDRGYNAEDVQVWGTE